MPRIEKSAPAPLGEVRSRHPYLTYEMIQDQPAALHSTLQLCKERSHDALSYLSGTNQFILTGCGTSFHAALASSSMMHALFLRSTIEAVQSFELTRYYRKFNSRTAVLAFSHSGLTKTTLDAAKRSKEAGAVVIGFTGVEHSALEKQSNISLVVGNGREKSRAHTKSYTSAVFASMYLSADYILSQASHSLAETMIEQLNDVPQYVHEALSKEKDVLDLVKSFGSKTSRYFFVGAGPNVSTSLEAGLKMKETNYASAEGMELEQFLHGPWVSCNENTLVVLIAPKGPSHDRYLDLLNACRQVQTPTVAITDDTHVVELATHSILMPELSEELTPLSYIVPLQLFAYHLSVQKGINPDFIHYQDPKYWMARNIIFPPGTH